MANIKISQLPYVSASGLTSDDVFPIVNYDTLLGTTKHTKLTDIQDYLLSGLSSSFTGGTVTGPTIFTNGLTSNTVTTSAITLNGITITGFTDSNFTGNTSATCITDLYVDNLFGCSPITIHDSLQTSTSTASGISSVAFGFNTRTYGDYTTSDGLSSVSGWKGFEVSGITNGLITLNQRYGDVTSEFTITNYLVASNTNGYTISNVLYDSILSATTIQLYETYVNGGFNYVADEDNTESNYADFNLGESSYSQNFGTRAIGIGSHSEGTFTRAIGDFSHSEGGDTKSIGMYSHSEGLETSSVGYASHSEGTFTQTYGSFSHSEGGFSVSNGSFSHAEGYNTESMANHSHSEGSNTKSYAIASHTEGYNTKTGFMGFQTTGLTGGNQIELDSKYGDVTSEFNGILITEYGDGLYTYPISAVTYNGDFTTITVYGSFGSSYTSVASINNLYSSDADVPSRIYSHAEGASTQAVGNRSHSEGYGTISYGATSHSEGSETKAYGEASHSEGFNTKSYSSGSHSEGTNTSAGWMGFEITGLTNGIITVASRYGDITSDFTINEQILVYDVFISSVETISGRTFDGTHTIIQLYNTSLNGDNSYVITHPVNYDYISSLADVPIGADSHSEGSLTKAISKCSYAGGINTVSAGIGQFVIGQFNTVDSTNGAFIIGNGTNNSNDYRSNLLFAGDNQVNISGKTITTNLQITSGASDGYILTSDVDGNATWQANAGSNPIPTTYTNFVNLINTSSLQPGVFYEITDPINADEGVIVQGVVTNDNPSLQGSGKFLNADYQNVGDYSGVSGYTNNLGIWSTIIQSVVVGDVVIWGNRHYKNLTGTWGTSPNTDTTNWELLSKTTTNGYIREIDFIKYDVSTNLVIYRTDKRLNEVEYYFNGVSDSISLFQWGRDLASGNKIIGNSFMETTNSYCSFLNNYIFNGHLTDTTNSLFGNTGGYEVNFISYGVIEVENNYGQIFKSNVSTTSTINCTTNYTGSSLNNNTLSEATTLNIVENSTIIQNNTFINSDVTLGTINNIFNENYLLKFGLNLVNNGFIFRRCNLSYNTAHISLTKNIIDRVLSNVFSSFEIDLDMSDPSIYDIGTQTLIIPVDESHNGIFYLYNSVGYTISKIADSASNHKNIYKPADGTTVSFQHTLVASSIIYDLVCDAPGSTNILVGRNYGCDFIEYQFDGELNVRTNLVNLA